MVLRAAYALGLIAATLAMGRIAAVGIVWGMDRWLLPVDDYVIQHAAVAGMLVIGLVAAVLLLTSSPRKLLIFEDHIRIKSRAWRSRILKADDIEEIALERGFGAWLSRGILRSPPLAFGLIGPGIHLRPVKGRSYFFRSRDTTELAEVLGSWLGRPISQQPLKKRRQPRKADEAATGTQAAPGAAAPRPAPGATASRTTRAVTAPGVTSGSVARGSAPPPPPGPADPEEDIDFDSIGLTEEEMRELLGEDG